MNNDLYRITICSVLSSNARNKPYRISKVNSFDKYEQRQLTRHHHNLKEELNVYTNRLQKCIDIVFPEFNSLFKSKYGTVYMNILENLGSAYTIAHTDIRTIKKCFDIKGKGNRISLSAEKLKEALAVNSLEELEGKEFYGEFCFETDPITSTKPHPVSHLAYSYSAQLVVLNDDGKVKEVIAVCDAGKVINQLSIEGQIEGGVVMGLGYALTENFVIDKGYVKSKYGTLGLIRATDAPPVKVILVHGPEFGSAAYGAKGVGELCTIPTAPAVAHAYYKRDGLFRTSLPLEKTAYRK